jgi:hypothetical protein
MKKISQEKILAYKYKGRIIDRYTRIWNDLDSNDLKLMLDLECKCYDPYFAYFEGLEEVVGCHDIWFERITESSLSDIVIRHSLLNEGYGGFNMESQVEVYTPDKELLFDFLILHSDTSISDIIIMGERFFQTIRKYESNARNEKELQFNLCE